MSCLSTWQWKYVPNLVQGNFRIKELSKVQVHSYDIEVQALKTPDIRKEIASYLCAKETNPFPT